MKLKSEKGAQPIDFQERTYRNRIHAGRLTSFRVTVKETDLWLQAETPLERLTREFILEYRKQIEFYINQNPRFLHTLRPWPVGGPMPKIVSDMVLAGRRAHTGPMAAVAGALAEAVGLKLLSHSTQVIVENGGDVFIKTDHPLTVAVFAGSSPLNLKIGLQVDSTRNPVAVCTSSGSVGHSLSLGRADAVCVLADSCSLADAAATAIANRVSSPKDIQPAIEFGQGIEGVKGIVVIIGAKTGFWGDIEIVPLAV
jgi:ApbE superfamily uncharacterized protein (UPF0280 family)